YRLRAKVTQEFVRAVGRSAIDLYAGHLTLSDEELRTARDEDARTVGEPVGPIRLILMGQVSAGKSSLVNALAQETRASVGPLPTAARVAGDWPGRGLWVGLGRPTDSDAGRYAWCDRRRHAGIAGAGRARGPHRVGSIGEPARARTRPARSRELSRLGTDAARSPHTAGD